MQDHADKIKKLKKRYEVLKSDTERANWESHCEQLAELVLPRKTGFVGQRTPGRKEDDKSLLFCWYSGK